MTLPFSDGIPKMPRKMTSREKNADSLFLHLQIISRLIFIVTAILGYYLYQIAGAIFFAILGYIFGIMIRRSLGIRGKDPIIGFYIRMQERGSGSRRGILEWMIENARGNEFTQEKCQAITAAYNEARQELNHCSSKSEREEILEKLDEKVKSISYD